MRTRRAQLTPDFVGAVNLAEVEFAIFPEVVDRAKKLLECFSPNFHVDENNFLDWQNQRDMRLSYLLDAMAKRLNTSIDQLDILSGGYAPKYWTDIDQEQQALRKLSISVLSGERPVSVVLANPPQPQTEATLENGENVDSSSDKFSSVQPLKGA